MDQEQAAPVLRIAVWQADLLRPLKTGGVIADAHFDLLRHEADLHLDFFAFALAGRRI